MDKSLHSGNAAGRIILFTCLLSLGYAILRYNIVGPTPWKDLSLYTLNKGIALSAFIILIFNFIYTPKIVNKTVSKYSPFLFFLL